MPVLESTGKLTPKSILRHRPIGDGTPPKRSIVTTATIPTTPVPVVQRASRPRSIDTNGEVAEWRREDEEKNTPAQTETRRTTTIPKTPRGTSRPRALQPKMGPLQQAHPLLYLGMGMLAMLILWTVLSAVFGWFTTTLDDLHYGRPRTFQTDAWVGHNEQAGIPSHFIAININRHIEIIEMPGGDGAHARIYLGPQLYGANDDLVPVTLKFVDVNGDHKPDMVVSFQGSRIVFINDQGGFRPLLPSERHQVEQFLQHGGQ